MISDEKDAMQSVRSMKYRFFEPFDVVTDDGKCVSLRNYLFEKKVPVVCVDAQKDFHQAEVVILPENVILKKTGAVYVYGVDDAIIHNDLNLKKGTVLMRRVGGIYGRTSVFDVCDTETLKRDYCISFAIGKMQKMVKANTPREM